MPKCPKCGETIATLNCWEKVWQKFEVYLNGEDNLEFVDRQEFLSADEADHSIYECPECGEDLCLSYQEVEIFLGV